MRSNAQSLSSLPRNALAPKLHSFFVLLPSRALSNPVVICVSRAFCSMDQEKRETARSLCRRALAWISAVPPQIPSSLSFARKSVNDCVMWACVYDGLSKRETVRCLTAVSGSVGWAGGGTTIYGLHRVCAAVKAMVFSLLWERVYKSESLGLQ